MKNIAYIGIGANTGDRLKSIKRSLKLIDENANSKVEAISSIYESEPFGITDQDEFFNAASIIKTDLTPHDLLNLLKKIEEEVGRKKREKWGPREIDLDILFYNDLIFSDEIITLPHPGIAERDFVLAPLCELNPELIHPVLKLNICAMIKNLNSSFLTGKIYKLNEGSGNESR